MSLHRFTSKDGLGVAPTEQADRLIFGHLFKLALPIGFENDAFWVADKVADRGFQAGWFFDELPDDKIDELVRHAWHEADVEITDHPEYTNFFKDIAERAVFTGSHAYTMARLDNVRVKG